MKSLNELDSLSIFHIDLEWKVVYVGSAHDSHLDQVLDEILVGPVPVGLNKFVLQTDPPDHTKLPPDDVLGVTVVLITCSYREREFVRVGYYVNNEFTGEYDEEVGPPPVGPNFDMSLVQRQILADKPRLTKFQISWGKDEPNNNILLPMSAAEQEEMDEEVREYLENETAKEYDEVEKEEYDDDVAGTPSTAGTDMDVEPESTTTTTTRETYKELVVSRQSSSSDMN